MNMKYNSEKCRGANQFPVFSLNKCKKIKPFSKKTQKQQASWSIYIYVAKSRPTFQNSTINPSFLAETRPHQNFKKL